MEKPNFICHPDFKDIMPINIFHKEHSPSVAERKHNDNFLNRHTLFRRKFSLQKPKCAALKITADDYYKLYINGIFVTQGPAPCFTFSYYFNEIDITDYLKNGENTIAVHTYYQGVTNRVWVSGDENSMFYFELNCDGQNVLVSDTSWKCTTHSGFLSEKEFGYSTAFDENYNSATSEDRFIQEDYDDSYWGFAAVRKYVPYALVPQPTKQLDFYNISPKTVKSTTKGVFIDFGIETVGYLSIRAKGKKGDIITILCGEELNGDGSVRYKMRCNCVYSEKWYLSGGTDTLNQFDYKAFRYVELVFGEGIFVDTGSILMSIRHYPYEEKCSFSYKNPRIKDVLRLCLDTIKYGTQEVIMDCPTREKGQYLGDLTISGRAHAVATGDTAMFKKAIENFTQSTFICKGIMSVAPSSLMQEIADYSLQFASQLLFIYNFDNDIDFLRKMEPYAAQILEYFCKYENADGLLDNVNEKWNLVDWPANLRDGYSFELTKPIKKGLHNVINAFWCGFLADMDEIYSILGMKPTGKTERVKKVFIETFYNAETRLFCDTPLKDHSAIQSNILPLLFNIGLENEGCEAAIVRLIKEKSLAVMGVYMAYFTLSALKKHGYDDLAEELICDERCWLNMLAEGATTTYEAWGKDQKWNTSLFHPWATAPIPVLAKNVKNI